MKHKIRRIHFVGKHARRRVRPFFEWPRGGAPRPGDADEAPHET